MSSLDCAELGCLLAFSGTGRGRDRLDAVGLVEVGPLPTGRYYTVDRQLGGRMGAIRDFMLEHLYGTDRSSWFALYRADGVIDDVTWVGKIQRGAFPLHPIGPVD